MSSSTNLAIRLPYIFLLFKYLYFEPYGPHTTPHPLPVAVSMCQPRKKYPLYRTIAGGGGGLGSGGYFTGGCAVLCVHSPGSTTIQYLTLQVTGLTALLDSSFISNNGSINKATMWQSRLH